MRLAVLVTSTYSRSGRLPELVQSESDVELLRQRLAEPDAAFQVYTFDAERGLADELEALLSAPPEPVNALLFFFAGYSLVSEGGFPTLVLDGERLSTLSLQRLRRLIIAHAPSAFVILDTVDAAPSDEDGLPRVRLFDRVLAGRDAGIHLLAANRKDAAASPSSLGNLMALTLDWYTGGELNSEGLFFELRREEMLFSRIGSAQLFPARTPFRVLLPQSIRPQSAPPPPEPAPSMIDAEARADAAMAAGDHDAALEAFALALEHVGSTPTARHTGLYLKVADALHAAGRSAEAGAYEAAALDVESVHGLEPDDPDVRRRLASLHERHGDPHRALQHLSRVVRTARGPGDFRTLMRLFDRTGRPDGEWNAACALEAIGEADINESLLASAHRPDGLLPARECLTEAEWAARAFCPERDPAIDSLLSAIEDAYVEIGIETARRKRRLLELDPSTAQDPEKTTATLIKMLAWSAKLLNVPLPRVHLIEGLRTPFLAPPVREPALLVSKALGSGLPLQGFAFLWSRQLVFLRPEHRAVVFFPTVAELSSLILATLSLGGVAQLPFKKLEGDAKPFARGLRRHLSPEALARLREVVAVFPVRDSAQRILAWARAVELAAGRAGLLSCGNLELAVSLTRQFPLGGLISPEQQADDLLGFSVSDEYASLRKRLGVHVRAR